MRVTVLASAIVVGLACNGGPLEPPNDGSAGSDDRTSVVAVSDSLVVRLLRPSENQIMTQNDSTIGCPVHRNRGFGFRIVFAWTPPSASDVAGYTLFVKHRTSQFPWLNILVDSNNHTETSCNGFIADHNLNNWEWKVRALDPSGTWGPWSELSIFHFEACRHADGRRCTAPGQ